MKKLLFLLVIVSGLFANERIIALSPSANEIIFALEKGDKVVGNTTYCRYPRESQAIEKVGGYFNPSLEKIVALRPTLVVMQQNNYKLAQKLGQLGISTKIITIDKLNNIKKSIIELGSLLKKEKKAKAIVRNIEKALDETQNIVQDTRILVVMGHNTSLAGRIFVSGQNLYFDDIINASGNTNALQSDRKGQPVLNMENIIATNPDIVILLSHSMHEKGLSRDDLINPWRELPVNAAKTDSIYIVDKLYAGIPSDRLVYFLNDFRGILNDYKNNH
jgi:iron complex transport system substrate-binding protein